MTIKNELSSVGFPVLNAPVGCAKRVDITKLNRNWAVYVHSQTLEELAKRGGLSAAEIKLNVELGNLFDISGYNERDCVDLVNSIAFCQLS